MAQKKILALIRKHQSKDNALAREIKLRSLRSDTKTGTKSSDHFIAAKDLPPPLPENPRPRLTGETLKSALELFRALATSTDPNGGPLEQSYATLIGAG